MLMPNVLSCHRGLQKTGVVFFAAHNSKHFVFIRFNLMHGCVSVLQLCGSDPIKRDVMTSEPDVQLAQDKVPKL